MNVIALRTTLSVPFINLVHFDNFETDYDTKQSDFDTTEKEFDTKQRDFGSKQ